MYAKRLRRKCSIRGCKNVDTFGLTRSKEGGNSVILCKDCLEASLEAVGKVAAAPVAKREPREAPPLFFNTVKKAEPETVEEAAEVIEPTEPEATEPAEETAEYELLEMPEPVEAKVETIGFVCPHCGKVCKSEQGLQKHIELKHKDVK